MFADKYGSNFVFLYMDSQKSPPYLWSNTFRLTDANASDTIHKSLNICESVSRPSIQRHLST